MRIDTRKRVLRILFKNRKRKLSRYEFDEICKFFEKYDSIKRVGSIDGIQIGVFFKNKLSSNILKDIQKKFKNCIVEESSHDLEFKRKKDKLEYDHTFDTSKAATKGKSSEEEAAKAVYPLVEATTSLSKKRGRDKQLS